MSAPKLWDFRYAIGRNGDAIPMPAQYIVSWGATARIFGACAGILGLAICGPQLLSRLGEIGITPLNEWLPRVTLLLLITPVAGALPAAVGLAVAFCWWPWSRKSFGRRLENRIERLSLEELNSEIAKNEAAWRTATYKPQKDGYLRYLAWLDLQRLRLHGVPASMRD